MILATFVSFLIMGCNICTTLSFLFRHNLILSCLFTLVYGWCFYLFFLLFSSCGGRFCIYLACITIELYSCIRVDHMLLMLSQVSPPKTEQTLRVTKLFVLIYSHRHSNIYCYNNRLDLYLRNII